MSSHIFKNIMFMHMGPKRFTPTFDVDKIVQEEIEGVFNRRRVSG